MRGGGTEEKEERMVQAAEGEKRTVCKGQDETDGEERMEEKNDEQKEERNKRKDG